MKGVFRTWNWPHMPVRIFTYRVGGDTTAGHNMKDMACTNKGLFYVNKSIFYFITKLIVYRKVYIIIIKAAVF